MSNIARVEGRALSTMTEEQTIATLRDSLYSGAKPESVRMVLAYCQAADLDPFQKPVHIVPMYVEDKHTGQKATRDIVMPGIGLYRTQAARSGAYGGIDEPEFGPDITLTFGEYQITVPEWCRVVARRIVGDKIVGFAAKEYWVENYATAGRDTKVPNSMWKRRPRGQIAKCAEAQALRRAFPEIGAAPTAEEMEGRFDVAESVDASTGEITRVSMPQRKSAPPAEDATIVGEQPRQSPPPAPPPQSPPPMPAPANTGTINAGQVKWIEKKLEALDLPAEARAATLARHGIKAVDQTITVEQFDNLKAELLHS